MSYTRLRYGGGDVTMAIDGAYRPCDDTAESPPDELMMAKQ